MPNFTFFALGCCVGLLAASPRAGAQRLSADSSASAATSARLRQHYTAGLGYEARLYNGPEYVNYVRRHVKGHQFFASNEPQPTTLEYGGATYSNVPLRYDIVQNRLVLKAPQSALDMVLVSENVSRFVTQGHTFIRLVATAPAEGGLEFTGYYDLLVDGPVRLLALRKKELQERTSTSGLEGEIRQKDGFYIYSAGRYHKAGKASTAVAVFPESKAELRKYIRTQKLKFGDDTREKSLVALVRYYATLPRPAAFLH